MKVQTSGIFVVVRTAAGAQPHRHHQQITSSNTKHSSNRRYVMYRRYFLCVCSTYENLSHITDVSSVVELGACLEGVS